MPRGGRNKGNKGGGKKWSRKRKAEERAAKSDKPRSDRHDGNGYATIPNSNAKFEAYYSLVGLHDTRFDDERKEFVPCANDAEKHAERDRFMTSLMSILPASFRVDRTLDETTQKNVLEELRRFAGKEMEVEIELPRRSMAFGGMKNILEQGITQDDPKQDDAAKDEVTGKMEDATKTNSEGNGKEGPTVVKKNDGEKKTEEKTDGAEDDAEQDGSDGKSADATTKGKEGNDNGSTIVKKTKQDDDAGKSADATTETNGEDINNKNDDGPVLVKTKIAPARPIPFITSNGTVLGYQLSLDRRTLRRNKSLEPLHAWLKTQTDCGHITRQETVSMIPPVVLDVKEGMTVLDMCAAPGSKTCQLVEDVGGLAVADGEGTASGPEPTGYVVANDADEKRAYMLVHQLRRMNSPAVFVTSCDGQYFPILDEKRDRGTEREGTFDRVLADVPCSGDGTVRKNPGIWRHWNQLGSLALHPLQLSIALRGARLTKVGGYIVYSTCSMNPMENESVVAELLRIAEGSLVLEDPRGRMEGLVARPGWGSWRVLRESKHRTKRAMKDWRKKNNPKMRARRKEWDEKRAVEGHYGPPAKEAKVEENQNIGGGKKEVEEKKEEEEKFVPSPYDTVPYVPPATWDDAALSERTTSLGFAEYASYDEVEPEWRRRVRASCFPPTEEEAKKFELHKCLRCLPQDMDTGGFFVALLKKVKPLSKNATQRMDLLAKESRGGEVDTHLSKRDDDGDKSAKTIDVANGSQAESEKESEDVTMTESSAAEDKSDIVLAQESKGEEVDECSNKTGEENGEERTKKSAANRKMENENESKDATMTESSAAGDQTDTDTATDKDKSVKRPEGEDTEKDEEEEEVIQKAPQGKVGMRHKHQKKKDLSKEDFVPIDPAVWPPIVEEYGLSPTFPKDQFMIRASGGAKVLYFISKSIKEQLIDRGIQDRVTVINSGLKGFERCSLKESDSMSYRLAQEGIQYIVPHVTRRMLSANMDDFYACVTDGFIPFKAFSEKFQKELEELSPGSFIVALEGYEKDVAKKMYLTMWRRRNNAVLCFVTKIEMEAVLSKMRALGHVPKKEDKEEEEDGKCDESKGKKPTVEDEMVTEDKKEEDGKIDESKERKPSVENKMDTEEKKEEESKDKKPTVEGKIDMAGTKEGEDGKNDES